MDKPKSNARPILAIGLLILIGLPILYLLSTGPVIWLMTHGYLPHDFWYIVPFVWLAQLGTTAKAAVVWWIRFWINEPR
jgi:hypothetical protein